MNNITEKKGYNGYLSNYPAYAEGLRTIASKLDTLSDTTQTHLADIGVIIGGHIKELKELQERILATHNLLIDKQ